MSSAAISAAAKTLSLRRVPPCRSLCVAADPQPDPDPKPTPTRPLRRDPTEELAATIAGMISRRPWTTRLQNSIRAVAPAFTRPLVVAVVNSPAISPALALSFFRWVEKTGFRHDEETYAAAVALLARSKMLNHARCLILDDMPRRHVTRTEPMLAHLIAAYGRARIPQESVKLFRSLPDLGVARTSLSYDAFFKAILSNGRSLMAKRAFNFMIKEGVAPQLSTFNTLIWGFSLSGKMETAKRFLDDMKARGIEPDVVTYNNLLSGWVRAGKPDEARRVFDEMGTPNIVSYNLMIKGLMGCGRVDEGMRLLDVAREKGLRTTERTYAALMPFLCDDAGRTEDAREVFDEMVERRITPKDKNKSVFPRLIASMFESGDLDGAVEVHRAMGRFRVRLDSLYYGLLIEGLCRGGRFDVAEEILDEMLERGVLAPLDSAPLEPSEYNPIIEHLCGGGATAKAETLFRQLMKRGVDDKAAFNHLIRGHAREGKPEAAFEILGIMTRRGVESDADAYVLLVESFLKKGEPADARTVLDGMIEQGHVPSAALFRSVMAALFDDGRVQTASRVMKSMIEKGVKENTDMAHKILEALFKRGHVEEALGRINLMLTNDVAPDFDGLVASLCDSGDAIPALKLVDFALERDCDMAFSSYDRLLEVLYDGGRTLPAYSILCKIKAKGGVVDKKGCEAVIKSLNEQGNTKQADILSRILAGKAPIDPKKGKKFAMGAY